MKGFHRSILGVFLIGMLAGACLAPSTPPGSQPGTEPPPAAASPTAPVPDTQPPALPTDTSAPEAPPAATATAEPALTPGAPPEEAIMILQPASGSRVVSPVLLEGISDPAFEGSLGVVVLNAEGGMVYQTSTQIQADIGQRGPFSVELPLHTTSDLNIFIQVYMVSPRDGGITHLSSVGVILAPDGPANIRVAEPYQERITILEPAPNASISGDFVQVIGFGWASFEQTLLIEVLDEEGQVLGSAPVIVQAPDLGMPGLFNARIPFTVSRSMPGRIAVRDISPAFGGDTHRSSIEVTLSP
jgi:hypothetical protein